MNLIITGLPESNIMQMIDPANWQASGHNVDTGEPVICSVVGVTYERGKIKLRIDTLAQSETE